MIVVRNTESPKVIRRVFRASAVRYVNSPKAVRFPGFGDLTSVGATVFDDDGNIVYDDDGNVVLDGS